MKSSLTVIYSDSQHDVEQLSDVEKLLLYIQLPNGSNIDTDILKA